ncbi:uncharacterized protein Ecym_2002 [Eremothecium cymbalariae DBVPG|uniref:Gfo/Idh/MocA-like oxidoreductase N-terminal domain-containing protein n=1 Tax=Eremothecium cymbalariae (strain CBS 270.75 / DBVPG 7215 / KCTC 17166 / NRRL Y-17582) TaxID=931890 RepID=G8JNF2_ERECY|nr:Hypothetical protein Ecym_2002 [Eremothecium cymbalariae DBVPG\
MNPILNVGILGTGIFAKNRHLPSFQSYPDKFKVVAACNRTKKKAVEFAVTAGISEQKVYDDVEKLMQDPDVTFIDALLPVQFNLTAVEKAVAAGKPILLEKPIAANLEQARAIVAISETTNVPIAIGENWLYLNSIDVVKSKLETIGEVVGFTYNSTGPFVKNNKYMETSWRQTPEHIGGFLSDGGVHQLALLTELLGEIESVAALTKQIRELSGADDTVFSTLKMRSGAVGTFTYGSAFGATNKWIYVKIYGTKGSILLDISNKVEAKIRVQLGDSLEDSGSIEEFEVEEEGSFGVNAEFLNFYEAVVSGDKQVVKGSPKVVFHHLACVAAFLDSSKANGSSVQVQAA